MDRRKNKKKMTRKKKLLYVLFTLIGLVFIVGGLLMYQVYQFYNQATENIQEDLNRGDHSELRDKAPEIDVQEPISVLLLGEDAEDQQRGRTDTMMVMTINPQDHSSYLLSIPRDTRTKIIGRGTTEKIAHAYAYGGASMAVDTVEAFLDMPIDYHITVNMDGFVSLIDLFDGVTVEVEQTFEQDGHSFTPGQMELDGEAALAYSRNRDLAGGDFDRNERQQQVVRSLIDEAVTFQSVTQIQDIIGEVEENVRTNHNMSVGELNTLRKDYMSATQNQERLTLEGEDAYIDNIYYFIVHDEERQRVSSVLREHLELDQAEETGE